MQLVVPTAAVGRKQYSKFLEDNLSVFSGIHVCPGFRGCPTVVEYSKAFPWERRRPAGKAFGINAAVILHSCRRDAGAPRLATVGQPLQPGHVPIAGFQKGTFLAGLLSKVESSNCSRSSVLH
jgi:hypothetical protein